jgi:hypothetical protein
VLSLSVWSGDNVFSRVSAHSKLLYPLAYHIAAHERRKEGVEAK